MQRIAAMFAVVLVAALVGGCESCIPPGCDQCQSPCGVHEYRCEPPGWESFDDPCDFRPDSRPSHDYIADLRSSDRAAREDAIDALARMGPAAFGDVGVLLSDPDRDVRYSALQVFVRLRAHTQPSIWYVKNRIGDSDAAIRADAVYVVGSAGVAGAEAIPELIRALNDPSPVVRYRAAVAFQRHGRVRPFRARRSRAHRPLRSRSEDPRSRQVRDLADQEGPVDLLIGKRGRIPASAWMLRAGRVGAPWPSKSRSNTSARLRAAPRTDRAASSFGRPLPRTTAATGAPSPRPTSWRRRSGTCVITIMAMAAERHGIDLTGATVTVEKHMTTEPPRRIARLPVRVRLPKRLTPEHLKHARGGRARLSRCTGASIPTSTRRSPSSLSRGERRDATTRDFAVGRRSKAVDAG